MTQTNSQQGLKLPALMFKLHNSQRPTGQQSTGRQPKHPLASEQQNVADTNSGAQPGDRDAGQGDGCEGKGTAVSLKTHFIERGR